MYPASLYGTSVTKREKPGRVLALLVVLCVLISACSLFIGNRELGIEGWLDVFRDSHSVSSIVVTDLRFPRTVLGMCVGIALGTAGALIQGHTRNPVADPVLLGISAGAGFFVAGGIFIAGIDTVAGQVVCGLIGATAATALVTLIGTQIASGMSSLTLVLGGVAVHAGFTAATTAMLLHNQQALDTYRFWTVGAISGRSWDIILPVIPIILVGLTLAAFNAPDLNALALGDEVAGGLGARPVRARIIGLAAIAVLTGAAVAAAGPIGFIGLMCGAIGRRVARSDWRWTLPIAGTLGVALLLGADILGRVVMRPSEIAVGITAAIVGAPFFIYMVRHRDQGTDSR
ncbi:FecCD family ABC transporter permease [Corynebacterium sp. TAE3-ERU16]|uniref:FecCD family ABC transporter permease n=1 Tax=Corynebacterium sp. TAE3-ERU16 TaxID=2849493 RepID=UPI001C47000A|nr:iron ABC transporter permease [Corynebacterium sp. TAE3-ERU16]MBV7292911.1 iron ABC transporter permease [Corynebacterium sp. TAE3-ERU16]